MSNLRHAINLGLFLFAVWLLLSGHYTPLLLVLGVLSTLVVVLLATRHAAGWQRSRMSCSGQPRWALVCNSRKSRYATRYNPSATC
jgi:multisubunit Na+/H+ antiporter MnhE subunit